MVFFRKLDPIERLEDALNAKKSAREKLVDRLAVSETMLVEKRRAAEHAAIAGASDAELDRVEAGLRAAEDRTSTLHSALSQLDEQITATERELADAETQRNRDMVANELETMASAISAAAPAYDTAAAKLIEAVTKSSATMLEANQFAGSLEAMRRDVGSASRASRKSA